MTKAALADGNRSIEQPQLFCWGTNLERKLQLGWRTLARIPSFELRPFQSWGFMLVATADEKITYEGCSAMIAGSLSTAGQTKKRERT